jgi:pyruvate,water dikinase
LESKALRINRPDLSALSDQQLWDRFMEMLPLHRKMFAQHIFTSYMATVPVGVITAVATAVGRPDLILPILSGIGDVDSAAPSHAMWGSRIIPIHMSSTRASRSSCTSSAAGTE